jgi:hypothetical protein
VGHVVPFPNTRPFSAWLPTSLQGADSSLSFSMCRIVYV